MKPANFRFSYRCAGCGEVFRGDAAEFAALGARTVAVDDWAEDPYCAPCWAGRESGGRGPGDWPRELDDAGIHADSIDIDAVSALWFARIEPYLSLSLHGDSLLAALRAGFAAGVATERGTLALPPPQPRAESSE
jgi:hypothetical protein